MANLWWIISELSKDELIDLLYEYDKYIEYAREYNCFDDGWIPVCLAEFYESEFALVMQERINRDQTEENGTDNPGWISINPVEME